VVERKQLRDTIVRILKLLRKEKNGQTGPERAGAAWSPKR